MHNFWKKCIFYADRLLTEIYLKTRYQLSFIFGYMAIFGSWKFLFKGWL